MCVCVCVCVARTCVYVAANASARTRTHVKQNVHTQHTHSCLDDTRTRAGVVGGVVDKHSLNDIVCMRRVVFVCL